MCIFSKALNGGWGEGGGVSVNPELITSELIITIPRRPNICQNIHTKFSRLPFVGKKRFSFNSIVCIPRYLYQILRICNIRQEN
jgi:hypothetical protein